MDFALTASGELNSNGSSGLSCACAFSLPKSVERDGANDHQAFDNVLPDVGHAGQDQPVAHDGNDEGADQRAPDRADTANETGTAENNRSDRVELIGLAELD